jgi:hypothetical protein
MEANDGKKKDGIVLYSMYRGPGPAYRLKTSIGTKDHCLTKSQAPAYTIGQKYQDRQVSGPGPTYYYDSAITFRGKAHAPAYALSGRPRQKGNDVTPGPGDYDTHNIRDGIVSDEHKTPSVSIGQRTKLPSKTEVPPPNAYDVRCGFLSRSQTAKNGPAWSLRGRSGVGGLHYCSMKADIPGPASYGCVNPSIYKPHSGTGFTIQGRTHNKDYTTLKDNPGPNLYNPLATDISCSGRKGFTMGIRHSEFIIPLIANSDKI